MPGVTIHREESENGASKLPSWTLIPSPRSPQIHGGVDSRALIPFSTPDQEPATDEYTQGANTDGPFHSFSGNPSGTDNGTGLTFYFATQIINITTPIVTQFPCPCEIHHNENSPRAASPRVVVEEPLDSDSESSMSRSSRSPRSPRLRRQFPVLERAPKFFSWDNYAPVILPKKRSSAMRTSHEEVIDAFDGIEVSGPVSGLGRFAKPLINKYHTSGFVSEFQASGERVLLLPSADDVDGGTPSTLTSTRRELERLECEIFDISKYRGNTNHLTVLTWASDSHWGTVTLFEVYVGGSPVDEDNWETGKKRATRREQAVNIRPIAAMEDVPKGILVNMRIDQDIRKTVLEYSTSEGRYKWRSQVRPGPVYTRILGSGSDNPELLYDRTREVQSATNSPRIGPSGLKNERAIFSSEEEDNEWGEADSYAKRGRRRERRDADGELEREYDDVPDRRRRPRPSSLLRVDDVRTNSTGRSRHRTKSSSSTRIRGRRTSSPAERDSNTGIVATIPQFLALLHATRSILEVVSSSEGSEMVDTDAEGKEGTMKRCVRMIETPAGRRHTGRDIHVVVLMPNASSWADERIVWADKDGELEDLRQKVFWDVIGRGRSCIRASSRASSMFEGSRLPRTRNSQSVDGRGAGRRTGGRRSREPDERSRSPPKSARW